MMILSVCLFFPLLGIKTFQSSLPSSVFNLQGAFFRSFEVQVFIKMVPSSFAIFKAQLLFPLKKSLANSLFWKALCPIGFILLWAGGPSA